MTATPTERSFRHTVTRGAGSRVVLEVEADADRLTRQTDRVFERHTHALHVERLLVRIRHEVKRAGRRVRDQLLAQLGIITDTADIRRGHVRAVDLVLLV